MVYGCWAKATILFSASFSRIVLSFVFFPFVASLRSSIFPGFWSRLETTSRHYTVPSYNNLLYYGVSPDKINNIHVLYHGYAKKYENKKADTPYPQVTSQE